MPVTLKLKLDSVNKLYRPGSEISGRVIVKDPLRSTFSIKGLGIRFLGVVSTFQIQGPYSQLWEEHVVADEFLELLQPNEGATISKGRNEFEFKLVVPQGVCPSVYINRYNKISYQVTASVPSSKFSRTPQVSKHVYIATNPLGMCDGINPTSVSAVIPMEFDDTLMRYGEGRYQTPLRKRDPEAALPEVLDVSDQNTMSINRGGSQLFSLLPDRDWGYDRIYSKQIHLDVHFPFPGVYTDQPLNLRVYFHVDGDLPRICLNSLKVSLTETTFISAKEVNNKERKHHTLFQLDGPLDLTTSEFHDFSEMITSQAQFPKNLIPNFDEKTMSRSYIMNVTLQFFKGSVHDEVPKYRNLMHARQPMQIYGNLEPSDIVPSYSMAMN